MECRTPRVAPIYMDMANLEIQSEILKITMRNCRHRILKSQTFIEGATTRTCAQAQELESLERSFGSVAYGVSSESLGLWQISQQLSDVTQKFHAIEAARSDFARESQRDLGQLASEIERARVAHSRSEHALAEVDAYIDSFPVRLQHSRDEADAVIAKRSQLTGELERKLAAVAQELAAEANAPERIQALTAELEGHWKDCQRLGSESDRLRRSLHALQEMLERKKRIFEFAQAEKIENDFVEPGLSHLEMLYDAAKGQNASMARVMRKLQREVAILEAEKAQYLHALAGGT
jgi:chromosome segregation ATPase